MVEGKGLGIGIVIGIVIGIAIGVIGSPLVGISSSNQSNPISDILETDDARLGQIQVSYFEENNHLVVALTLTDSNAEYTKSNGHLELRVCCNDRGMNVYSNEYDVTKDDFISWKTNFGDKITGFRIDETKYFSSGSYDVSVDFTKTDGTNWKDLHASFYSLG